MKGLSIVIMCVAEDTWDTWQITCPAMKHESYVKQADIGERCQELIDEYKERTDAGI